ncbi:MAG: exonuclease domain-containing protein [Phycisphaerales bacterium]|nr:exonuclease domain-containing protein [Phycisphaerales bacterium]
MNIQLKRPLVIFDLETTGLSITADRIIEICMIKIKPDGTDETKKKYVDPEIKIPEAAIAVHGITNEQMEEYKKLPDNNPNKARPFKTIANEIKQFIVDCDLAGFNCNRCDIPFLMEEFLRAGLSVDFDDVLVVDVQKIFHQMEPRTLTAAYKFYCNADLTPTAHSAVADATATWEVLEAQVKKYETLGNSLDSIIKAIGKEEQVDYARRIVMNNGVEVFNFGKHKGKEVVRVFKEEEQYYHWMMNNDFSLHTKEKLKQIYQRYLLQKAKK